MDIEISGFDPSGIKNAPGMPYIIKYNMQSVFMSLNDFQRAGKQI